MSCLGAVIGGTIGLFLGGPLGAIAGAAFGGFISGGAARINFGDQNSQNQSQDRYSSWYGGGRMNQNQRNQMTFFVGAFSMLAKIASVDGKVSDRERRKVEEFMDRDLNLDASTKQSAFRIFDTALNSNETFYQFANQFYKEFRFQPQMFELMIDIMIRVAVEDNGISSEEETLIIDGLHIFRLDDNVYARLKAKYTGGSYNGSQSRYSGAGSFSSSAAYSVLGCSQSDSNEKIKKAYRKLVSEYHPDKISSKGLPEEFQKVAKQKFIEIQNAWDQIKKERGL